MTSGVVTFFVSLQEAVSTLTALVGEYRAALTVDKYRKNEPVNGALMCFEPSHYMSQLIQQIFKPVDGASIEVGTTPSIRTLMSCGIDQVAAITIEMQVFYVTVEAISAVLPSAPFGQPEGFIYDYAPPCDLMVSMHRSALPDQY